MAEVNLPVLPPARGLYKLVVANHGAPSRPPVIEIKLPGDAPVSQVLKTAREVKRRIHWDWSAVVRWVAVVPDGEGGEREVDCSPSLGRPAGTLRLVCRGWRSDR